MGKASVLEREIAIALWEYSFLIGDRKLIYLRYLSLKAILYLTLVALLAPLSSSRTFLPRQIKRTGVPVNPN